MGTSTAPRSAPESAARENAMSGARGTRAGFARLLDGFREELERELASWLAERRTAGSSDVLETPEMAELVDNAGQLATRGGKRLRPALLYYAYRACGGRSPREVLPLALAVELLHTYLLIHDDIMDHAEVRRGEPAAHVRFREAHRGRGWRGDSQDFGRSVAILLGDLAHSWAVELFSAALLEVADRPRADELRRTFSAMCEEVIGGQYLDLLVALRRGTEAQAGEEELTRVLRLKSGRYTAERPVELGAILAGASPEARAALSRYGAAIGEAFQLQDDLLGTFGDAETVGKPVGADLAEGKFTFLIFHALEAAAPPERQALEAALGRPNLQGDEVARMRRLIEETGARRKVTAMVESRLATARDALAGLDLAPEGRLFLEGLIDELWERER